MTLIERVASERRAEEALLSAMPDIEDIEHIERCAAAARLLRLRDRGALALAVWNAPGPNIDRR